MIIQNQRLTKVTPLAHFSFDEFEISRVADPELTSPNTEISKKIFILIQKIFNFSNFNSYLATSIYTTSTTTTTTISSTTSSLPTGIN